MTTRAPGRLRPRNAAPRMVPPAQQPMRVPATLIDVKDREGLARMDSGGVYRVFLPDVLWLREGDRVLLYHYPHGWVAVLRINIGPALSYDHGRRGRNAR
jgi:hypothetical protein